MNENQLIRNARGKRIQIKASKHQNCSSRPPLLNPTTDEGITNDLGDNLSAPDGGWGWLVATVSGLSILVTYPVLQQYGILFIKKFSDIGITSSGLTTILNVQQATAMCSGLFNGPLFRRFSHRQVALIGTGFVFSGLFLAVFANSFLSYLISISLLYGIGRGIMFSTITVVVNTYFKAKRQEAAAYQIAVAGVGPMVLPYIVTFLVPYYGVAGTVLLLSGLSLNNLACLAIYQPVKWHAKKVPQAIPLQDIAHQDENSSSDSDKPDVFAMCKLEVNKQTNNSKDTPEQVTVTEKPTEMPTTENKSLPEQEELIYKKLLNSSAPAAAPARNLSLFKRIVVIFDFDLLQDFGYVNIVIGLTFMNLIHMNFHYLTPFILNEFGLDRTQIAKAMTVEAISGFVMKLLIVLIVVKLKCDNKIWLIMGCLGMKLGRLILVLNQNNIVVLVCFAWIGFSSAILLVFWNLILPTYVPLNRLPAAIGLQRLIMGIFYLIIGPLIGLIRDATNYSCIIHIMNAIILLVILSWLGEDLYRKWRRSRFKTQSAADRKN